MVLTTELVSSFLTIAGTIFVLELTDKDAMLLLSLATERSPWLVFCAGSIAFTITSAIIVLVGTALVRYVPLLWVKVAGGAIMILYAVWSYSKGSGTGRGGEARLMKGGAMREFYAFLVILLSLVLLDLSGDATEVVTVLFIAQYEDALLVFAGAVTALIAASGLEATLGNRLGRALSSRGTRYLSTALLLFIGSTIVVTSVLGL